MPDPPPENGDAAPIFVMIAVVLGLALLGVIAVVGGLLWLAVWLLF